MNLGKPNELAPFSEILIKGMKNILEGRKYDSGSISKYREFIGDDIKDKIKRKYPDLAFSVNVAISSSDSPNWLNSNGYFCGDDILLREEYKDCNWVCHATIQGVAKKNREENREKGNPAEIQTQAQQTVSKILEKFLFGKVYDQSLTGRDLIKILDEINEAFKFDHGKEYSFMITCMIVDKSKGNSEFGSTTNLNTDEDFSFVESYTTDEAADQGIHAKVEATFFKFK